MAEGDENFGSDDEDVGSAGDWLWPFKWVFFWCVLAPFIVMVISFLVCVGNGGFLGAIRNGQ